MDRETFAWENIVRRMQVADVHFNKKFFLFTVSYMLAIDQKEFFDFISCKYIQHITD